MNKCKYCQSEIDKKATVCPYCRRKQSNIGFTLFIIISIVIIACSSLYIILNHIMNNSLSSIDESFLKEDASSFTIEYVRNCAELEKIANEVKSYWYDSIFEDKYNGDINEATKQALEDNKVKVQNQKDGYDDMKTSYTEIINSNCKTDYCIKIKDNIKNAYKIYKNFYDLAIYPSGSYYQYSDNFKKIDSKASQQYEELEILLGLFDD